MTPKPLKPLILIVGFSLTGALLVAMFTIYAPPALWPPVTALAADRSRCWNIPVPTLYSASANGDVALVKQFLAKGVNPNQSDLMGKTTPLHIAVSQRHTEVVKLLLSAGANPNYQGRDGLTPLVESTRYNTLSTTQALLNAGANPNQTYNGNTLLYWASYNGYSDLAVALLKAGANPNVHDNHQSTPVHWAVLTNKTVMLRHLLDHGANPNVTNKAGFTPLSIAAANDRTEMIALLKQHGANR